MDDTTKHLFEQAKAGEFATLDDEARSMTARQFATKYGAAVHGDGAVGQYRVTVEGCDYYWNPVTGRYDGWGRSI